MTDIESALKIKKELPKFDSVKNFNKTQNEFNNKNILSKKCFSQINNIKNNIKNIYIKKNFKIKKDKDNSLLKIPTYIKNNHICNEFVFESKDISTNLDIQNKNTNNNKQDINNNLNASSHNAIITDLLNKTEKYFNKRGFHLNENNKKDFINFNKIINYDKIKINKSDLNDTIEYKLEKKDINQKKNITIKINENIINNTKIKINKNNNKNIKENNNKKFFENVINKNDYNNKNNNQLIYKTILIKNNSNINEKKEKKLKNINNKNNNINVRLKYKNVIDNKHLFKLNKKVEEKSRNILPILSTSLDKINSYNYTNKIKIAEVRRLYPSYSIIRKSNLNNLNNNKSCKIINEKILLNNINNFNHDNRYNFKQIMNNIKYMIRNKTKNNYIYNPYKSCISKSFSKYNYFKN